ncbi:MAG: hypothetical protein ACR2GW_09895 [Pyrinomonadaceae bacterium]|nr:hypothetical protein [Acidobacteriota bacterium]
MQQHISILGALYIVFGALGLLAAVIVFVSVVGGGLLSGDREAIAVTSGVGFFVALLIAILSLPSLAAGIGLLKRRSWSRLLALIVGCISLLNFPFGTALGIYTLWAMTRPETQSLLSR